MPLDGSLARMHLLQPRAHAHAHTSSTLEQGQNERVMHSLAAVHPKRSLLSSNQFVVELQIVGRRIPGLDKEVQLRHLPRLHTRKAQILKDKVVVGSASTRRVYGVENVPAHTLMVRVEPHVVPVVWRVARTVACRLRGKIGVGVVRDDGVRFCGPHDRGDRTTNRRLVM